MNKLKIITSPWHTAHFWDLFNALKEDADFYLIHNTNRPWFTEIRPVPENAFFVPYYEKGKYDLAILDIDQQCVNFDLGKSVLYRELNKEIQDIPKIVINHGSPVYPEFLKIGDEMTFEQAENKCREIISSMVGKNTMVVNSYAGASPREWGWGNPIWHGMNDKEWFDLEKEPRIFTSLSPGGCDEYYNREVMNDVIRILDAKYGLPLWWAKVNVETDKKPDDYKNFLGSSMIYLDVSFRTPMNRARTEAMLSGCCVVQVEGAHDLEEFAKDGINMVLVPNSAEKIAAKLNELLDNRKTCLNIGRLGKETAKKLFNYKRYREDWLKLINKILWR